MLVLFSSPQALFSGCFRIPITHTSISKLYWVDILRAGGCLKLSTPSSGPPAESCCTTVHQTHNLLLWVWCTQGCNQGCHAWQRWLWSTRLFLKGLSEFSVGAEMRSLQHCNSNVRCSSALSAGLILRLIPVSCFSTFLPGTKLQWSSAITLAVFVWLFTAFWSAMPLIGWGEYDYEPLRTCCTLDYSKGDRWARTRSRPADETHVVTFRLRHWGLCFAVSPSTETTSRTWSPCPSSTWPSRCLWSCPPISPLHRNSRRPETPK